MRVQAWILLFAASAMAQVPFQRIVNADKEPGNWLSYSRSFNGNRYSPLDEINTGNISQLKVKWAHQLNDPSSETSPIVVDGLMYINRAQRQQTQSTERVGTRCGIGNVPCRAILSALDSAM